MFVVVGICFSKTLNRVEKVLNVYTTTMPRPELESQKTKIGDQNVYFLDFGSHFLIEKVTLYQLFVVLIRFWSRGLTSGP